MNPALSRALKKNSTSMLEGELFFHILIRSRYPVPGRCPNTLQSEWNRNVELVLPRIYLYIYIDIYISILFWWDGGGVDILSIAIYLYITIPSIYSGMLQHIPDEDIYKGSNYQCCHLSAVTPERVMKPFAFTKPYDFRVFTKGYS